MNILISINKCELCNNKATYFKIFSVCKHRFFNIHVRIYYVFLCDNHRLINKEKIIDFDEK